MHKPNSRAKLVLGLIFVSVIFIALRLKTLNHLLMWDEARNIISLRAFLINNTADPFYWNYFFHPPLYMIFAGLLAPFKAGLAIRLEILSMAFSYMTLLIIYILCAKLGGWKYAFLSGLCLSVMPISIAYDSWIKRDCLSIALGYLAVFLLFKRKILWCAIALSFSLLAKENALFFILAVTFLIFALKEEKIIKKLVVIYGLIFILVSWWYIFFSSMPKDIFTIYLSAKKYALAWANSPLYYFGKLLPDMGLPILIFFLIGVGHALYLIFQKKQYRWWLPIITALCVYIPSSFIICKAPWISLSAVPALAMIAGSGALFLIKRAKNDKFSKIIFILLLVFSILGGTYFSYMKYHIQTYENGWKGANFSKELALYLNQTTKDNEKLMLTQFSYWGEPPCLMCPVFLYYLDSRQICVIDGRDSGGEVIKAVIANKISWLVVMDSPYKQLNFHALVAALKKSALGKPVQIGCSYAWKTDGLWRNNNF